MLIDTHCHFFTKSMLSKDMMAYASSLSGGEGRNKQQNINRDMQRMMAFLQVGYTHDGEGLYRYMEEAYRDKFIAVPLMLDVSYAMASPEEGGEDMTGLFMRFVRSEVMKVARGRERLNMWAEDMAAMLQIIKHRHEPVKLFDCAYEGQLRELMTIKKLMPDRVFPFYSIDPRRDHEFKDGVLGEIQRYVGKNKPFVGLKLYSSLGYSPTDPVLYGGGDHPSVYSWCEGQGVPITVHYAPTGFCHMLSACKVRGDVYYPAAGKVVPVELLYEEGKIPFEKSIQDHGLFDVAEERLLLLNHPKLWRKVLEKYPLLRINFAHCGGKDQLVKSASGDSTGFWTDEVLDMVCTFKNVYADLSCFDTAQDGDNALTLVHDAVYCKLPPRAKRKILYGSDFYMLFLYDQPLDHYHNHFVEAFHKDFGSISEDNPTEFLNIHKGWIN